MVEFGGWDMPVEYSGIADEHMAVRTRAGLFDVSHMGEIEIAGADALKAVQHITSNDASKLQVGQIQYSALTTPEGTFVDDLLVYRKAADSYLLVVNASNTPKDFAWARSHSRGDATIDDASDRYALIAVQGPRAAALISRAAESDPTGLAYYAFLETRVFGAPALVSRTGYTGEDGFEIYLAPEHAESVFRKLLQDGKAEGAAPCGLGARDTLRLEAKMALYGNDIDDTVTPWEADLGWIVKMKKGDFLGREALERQKAEGVARKLVGFEMVDRGIARHGYPARAPHGEGVVTSGTHSPTLGKPIGLAMLPTPDGEIGTELQVDIRGRAAKAQVVPTPFYRRAKTLEEAR